MQLSQGKECRKGDLLSSSQEARAYSLSSWPLTPLYCQSRANSYSDAVQTTSMATGRAFGLLKMRLRCVPQVAQHYGPQTVKQIFPSEMPVGANREHGFGK